VIDIEPFAAIKIVPEVTGAVNVVISAAGAAPPIAPIVAPPLSATVKQVETTPQAAVNEIEVVT